MLWRDTPTSNDIENEWQDIPQVLANLRREWDGEPC